MAARGARAADARGVARLAEDADADADAVIAAATRIVGGIGGGSDRPARRR
jgi:hypothetical protein